VRGVLQSGRRRHSPFFIIDSHPVDVCRTARAQTRDERLNGLAKIGYCAGASRWYCGVREHLIFTPHGMLALVLQVPGNRHDVHGLHALLRTDFRGTLFGDNAYTPGKKLMPELQAHGIQIIAQTRKDSRTPLPAETRAFVHDKRCRVERRIGLFCRQFAAGRTLCRSQRHYEARRWFKLLCHNLSRHLNPLLGRAPERMLHFRVVA
jgi:hypothetical protein